jgi:antitoxin component of RelBE/YafQ-DinJ toxin-antitoxin module
MKDDRIYIRINSDLKKQAQQHAADTGRTLAGLIEWLLRQEIEKAGK